MLWQKEDPANRPCPITQVADDDPEVLPSISCNAVIVAESNSVLSQLEMFIGWGEIKEILATATVFLSLLHKKNEKILI